MAGKTVGKPKSRGFKLEKTFQKYAVERLRVTFGELAWVYVPPTLSRRGIPDLLICVAGLFVAWELKLDTAKPDRTREALQEYECGQIAKAMGISRARVTPKSFDRELAMLLAVVDDYLGEIGQQRSVHS